MLVGRQVLGLALLLSTVAGCASRAATSPPPRQVPATTTPSPGRGGLLEKGLVDAWQPKSCKVSTVYFDFDSAILDPASRETLTKDVTCYMNDALPTQFLVTGSTDPRGTEEYNLALGHRRASSVSKLLITLGIPAQRVITTSIGEERAAGQDETGYRLDRSATTLEQ
jgi:peptidoglycan-associated lipoprotein